MTDTATPTWRTSSHSSNGQACVDVAPTADAVLLRDTKDAGTGPVLRLSHPDWAAFLAGTPTLTITETDQLTTHNGHPVTTHWHLRDPHGVTLHFTKAEWTAFWAGATNGEFTFNRERQAAL